MQKLDLRNKHYKQFLLIIGIEVAKKIFIFDFSFKLKFFGLLN